MNTLRVVPPPGPDAGLSPEQTIALDIALDAACERDATPLTSMPVAALVDAVPHMLRAYEDIARAVWAQDGGRGVCSLAGAGDPERWHPLPNRDTDPFSTARCQERATARRLCGSCPVKSECLVWSFANEAGGNGAQGTLGGLSETDRHDLRPVYRAVRVRLEADAVAAASAPTVASDNKAESDAPAYQAVAS